MSRFVWFAPNAGIWISYLMEHRAANALADSGHDVLLVQCDSVLDAICPTMSAMGVRATDDAASRHAVCGDCRHAAAAAHAHARYRTVPLSHLLPEGATARADAFVARATHDNWADLELSGIPIGLHAAYTSLLHHKVPEVTSTHEAWDEYLADLRGAALVVEAMPALDERIDATHAVVYNALYPANRAFAEWMLRRRVPLLNISGGPTIPRRYATLAVYDGLVASQTVTDSAAFVASMAVPCSPSEVEAVGHHLQQLMAGSDPWVYSGAATGRTATEIRDALDLRPSTPVVAIIASSLDETRSFTRVGAVYLRDGHPGFSEPPEFLAAAVELARSHPEIDFVVRLHPRLVPNKRDSMTSPDLLVINELLADLPANCVVNHPNDGLSIYDLLLISDAALNHTSSAGLEFLAWGVPVVQYDPERSLLYPLDFSVWTPRLDPRALDAALVAALESGFDLERSVRAIRWYATLQARSVVNLEPLPIPGRSAGQSPHAAARPHPLGRFVPEPVKRRIALRRERAARVAQLDTDIAMDSEVTAALLAAVDATTGASPVWEPHLSLPPDAGRSLDERTLDERAAVLALLRRLSQRLDLAHRDGLGVLRDAGLGRSDPDELEA
jgi:hypothetical protein